MVAPSGIECPRTLRLIKLPPMSGFSQMALDHALLLCARKGGFVPVLRFQSWEPPAVSLGRFQDIAELDLEECAARGIDVVRRPTGGKALLHLDDFTYSVILPPTYPLPPDLPGCFRRISGGIARALEKMGLHATIGEEPGSAYRKRAACFASANAADLKVNGRKICGSAQLRRKGAVLQHGTIYLRDRSALFHRLLRQGPGEEVDEALRELSRSHITLEESLGRMPARGELELAFIEGFQEELELEVADSELTPTEQEAWKKMELLYRSPEWVLNRERRMEPELEETTSTWG